VISSLRHIMQTSTIFMEEKLWHSLTDIQKRVAAVAAVVFALLLTSYLLFKLYREEKETEDNVPAVITKSPIKVQQETQAKEEPEASKIPGISGYGFIRLEQGICEKLFETIYAKKFFDPITEPQINEIIDQFAKLVQAGTWNHKVRVELYKDGRGPAECHQNGCHFHIYTYHGNFSSNTYREIAMSTSFINSFDKLSEGDNIHPPLKKLLLKVVDEMDAALKAEAKRKAEKATT
jgi:hypothetical protein